MSSVSVVDRVITGCFFEGQETAPVPSMKNCNQFIDFKHIPSLLRSFKNAFNFKKLSLYQKVVLMCCSAPVLQFSLLSIHDAAAMSSVSVVDRVITGCFFEGQETAPVPSMKV
ncbi:PREDICTED: uncharacterized protein LOC105109264 isoform X2 [Populus euphratica]|uniref:Uncharacterized protein LOC105109264 isoform X2 n=1 Tax=Populus euphratica TaxID=75702 RepID=A0AAJ6T073_POPEU|nr:PREDICTED: uncharacterized protein LOC105109264 isoform X2 [Populus euphratica]